MSLLLLKLILTPIFVAAASVAGRRWGTIIGGLLVGLPLTSGPVTFYLALGHGTAFAASAALGTLAGTIAEVFFCLSYCWLAFHFAEPLAILGSLGVFLLMTLAIQHLPLSPIPCYVVALAFLFVAQRLLPGKHVSRRSTAPPGWDIPARVVLATMVVLLLTTAAPALGPRLSGLLATFPVFLSTLGVFIHWFEGAPAVADLLRGAVAGLYSFATFFLVVALLVVPAGIAVAFVAATATLLATQGSALWLFRRAASAAT
jgi:hypothetical protein